MYYKRTLILNDITAKTSSKKGVITLENNDNKIKGSLKLYNFDTLPPSVAIGISSGDDIIKVPISGGDSCLEFDVLQKVDLQDKISCALVDISEKTCPKIIIGGTSNYLNDWADKVEQSFFESPKPMPREDMYDTNIAEIEQEISTVLREDRDYCDCDRCKDCKYKKAFFENMSNQPNDLQEQLLNEPKDSENLSKIKEILSTATLAQDSQKENPVYVENKDNSHTSQIHTGEVDQSQEVSEDKDTFYDQIKDQLDELFQNHKREETLEGLIPGSKWVKVEYEDVEGHYVVGLVYDEDTLLFISYGLPAVGPASPPPDLAEYAQWLPLGEDNEGEGYWLVYQNAINGESIKIE